jgi:hypothetical protein
MNYVLDACALVTADHHELDAVDRSGDVRFFWIR